MPVFFFAQKFIFRIYKKRKSLLIFALFLCPKAKASPDERAERETTCFSKTGSLPRARVRREISTSKFKENFYR